MPVSGGLGGHRALDDWVEECRGKIKFWRAAPWRSLGFEALFASRPGGFSPPPFECLNLSYAVGDDPEAVHRNRAEIVQALPGELPRRVRSVEQVHGTDVATVESRSPRGAEVDWLDEGEADAMMCSDGSTVLATLHADCLPVYLIDPGQGTYALAHAGWRGLFSGVLEAAVEALRDAGSRPGELLAACGPAVDRDAYEVDAPVLRALRARGPWWRGVTYFSGPGRARLDLGAAARHILGELGIPARSILRPAPGTASNPADFFSHRRDGTTGRCAALLGRHRHRD